MIWIVMIYMILKHVWTCSDSIWYEFLQFMQFSNMSEHVETCLKLFRFNMIQIVTIHAILKHVWTCSNMSKLVQIYWDTNCYDSYNSQTCWNMSKLVETCLNLFRYDMNCYDSQTCQNMFKQTCQNLFRFNNYDTNCYISYDSQTCLNMFKHV